jgi:hypothetical protein
VSDPTEEGGPARASGNFPYTNTVAISNKPSLSHLDHSINEHTSEKTRRLGARLLLVASSLITFF